MPIRMTEDDPQGNKKRKVRRSKNPNSSSFGGQGLGGLNGGMGKFVVGLLPMLMKRPKLLIILVIAGLLFYLFFGKSCSNMTNFEGSDLISNFVTGGEFDEKIYEETEIYEPLADNIKNPLPERVSLEKYAPKRLNQGEQGSCVAWASAYAARTILESKRTGKNPNQVRFSPSFMYNQISIDHRTCQGSYIKLAMDNMYNQGAVPFEDFRYDPTDCNKDPGGNLKRKAAAYKIKGFQRLTERGQHPVKEMLAIKQNLAKGSPVIIGMMVGGSFMNDMIGQDVWIPTNYDYSKSGFGGHAMCVIGYDDYKEGGAFQIMNSWGEQWGNQGIAWVRYFDFKEFNVESYGLYPMGDANAKEISYFTGSFGLELNEGKGSIDLVKTGEHYFETNQKLSSTDRFKVEFTNNMECYTYIFGEETDGSSYLLFPYTEKHSPYCGITGTRLFPRDYSMQPDEKGTKDKIAIVITKEPIDYNALNKQISNATGNSYEEKLQNLIGSTPVNFTGSKTINFKADAKGTDMVYFVIGVNK